MSQLSASVGKEEQVVFLIGLTSDQEQVSSCCFFFILMNYRGGKRWISRARVALGAGARL